MSDVGTAAQMKPQDTLILLLGELKGETRAIREGQAASQAQQAQRDAENQREHEEFRRTDAAHAAMLAVLNDNKATNQQTVVNRPQWWNVLLQLPATLIAIGGVIYLILKP